MAKKDVINITINIADVGPLSLQSPRDKEEMYRTVERNVHTLWAKWMQKFEDMSSQKVLAMVAFRFAELYYEQDALNKESDSVLEDFEKRLDEILLKVDTNPKDTE
jgi:hypothetical protein